MPEKGWLRRASRHAQKKIGSDEFREFDPQMQQLIQSFVDFFCNDRGLEGTWIARESDNAKALVEAGDARWKDYVSFKGIHDQRQIGLIHLGFTEQATQQQIEAHRAYAAQLHGQWDAAAEAILIPKAENIAKGFRHLKGLVSQVVEKGCLPEMLKALLGGIEAVERGKHDQALSYFVTSMGVAEKLEKDRASFLSLQETQQRRISELQVEINDALAEIETLEGALRDAKNPAGSPDEESLQGEQPKQNEQTEDSSLDLARQKFSAFREYLEAGHRQVSDSLNALLRHQETTEDSEKQIGAQRALIDLKQQEARRLRQALSTGAHKLSRTELSDLLQQLKETEDGVEAVESELAALEIQAREFKKTAMNPVYNRSLREAAAGLGFVTNSCRVVEGILDQSAWEGNFGRWEELHPEYAKPSAQIGSEENQASLSTGENTSATLLEQHREILTNLPISVLYTKKSHANSQHRGGVLPDELLEGGINAYSVLSIIVNSDLSNTISRIGTLTKLEYHIAQVPHARKNAQAMAAGVKSGLREKDILDEDHGFSWENLERWIKSLS